MARMPCMAHAASCLASQYGARATSPMERMLAWTGRLGAWRPEMATDSVPSAVCYTYRDI